MTARPTPPLPREQRLRFSLAALALLLAGAVSGAGAVSLTRPTVEMAPGAPTPIARLSDTDGIVSVRGRITDSYGDRFVVQDATGHALVDAGPRAGRQQIGSTVTVQGRFDRGQLRARFLVDASDRVQEVGPPPPPAPPPPAPPGPPPPPPPGALPPPHPGAVPPPPGAAGPDLPRPAGLPPGPATVAPPPGAAGADLPTPAGPPTAPNAVSPVAPAPAPLPAPPAPR